MEQVFDANERRIRSLEEQVEELVGELGSGNAGGSKTSLRLERKEPRADEVAGSSSGDGGDGATWFGATF